MCRGSHDAVEKKSPGGSLLHQRYITAYECTPYIPKVREYMYITLYVQSIHFHLGRKSDTNDQVMMLPVEKGGKFSFELPPIGI